MSGSESNSPERGEDGCVICTETAECPVCAEDEYCMMTAMTCDQCPTTYCAKKSVTASLAVLNNLTDVTSANLSTTNQNTGGSVNNGNVQKGGNVIGSNGHKGTSKGTVGGVVVGLIIVFAVIGFIVHKRYWRGRRRRRSRSEPGGMDRGLGNGIKDEGDISGASASSGSLDETGEPIFNGLSSDDYNGEVYHNSDRGYGNRPDLLEQYNDIVNLRNPLIQNNSAAFNGLFGADDISSIRSSKTDASSLLPIAYIPGVTSSGPPPLPRNISTPATGTNPYGLTIPGNVASHITLGSSVLGDIDEVDKESLIQPPDITTMNTVHRPSPQFSAQSIFTTAMRAKPKLVQIDKNGSTEYIPKGGNQDE